jgi:hypothetical protein
LFANLARVAGGGIVSMFIIVHFRVSGLMAAPSWSDEPQSVDRVFGLGDARGMRLRQERAHALFVPACVHHSFRLVATRSMDRSS